MPSVVCCFNLQHARAESAINTVPGSAQETDFCLLSGPLVADDIAGPRIYFHHRDHAYEIARSNLKITRHTIMSLLSLFVSRPLKTAAAICLSAVTSALFSIAAAEPGFRTIDIGQAKLNVA